HENCIAICGRSSRSRGNLGGGLLAGGADGAGDVRRDGVTLCSNTHTHTHTHTHLTLSQCGLPHDCWLFRVNQSQKYEPKQTCAFHPNGPEVFLSFSVFIPPPRRWCSWCGLFVCLSAGLRIAVNVWPQRSSAVSECPSSSSLFFSLSLPLSLSLSLSLSHT